MLDVKICDETNEILKEVRKTLKNKGYNKSISKCNRHLGSLHLNYVTEYYTKANEKILFEIEKDLNNNTINTKLHYIDANGKKDFHNIQLIDVLIYC